MHLRDAGKAETLGISVSPEMMEPESIRETYAVV